jgi:Fungal specific transcription factor domain
LASEGKDSNEPPRKKLRPAKDTHTNGEPITPVPASPYEPHISDEVIQSVIDAYFASCQNQPYSFFHEGHFRQRFEAADIPKHLILAIMATAIRFSNHPYFTTENQDTAIRYANRSWKSAVSDCLMTGRALDVDLVQTLGLLSLYDFTGKLA